MSWHEMGYSFLFFIKYESNCVSVWIIFTKINLKKKKYKQIKKSLERQFNDILHLFHSFLVTSA